ncbi:beta-ketoacyl synthase chain length factor [Rubrivivax sp. RP6-9]|uniref:beta-ketoacyl synthase chain length factor n=1 Tax=Rubrivivax sp. RP6-9 TaxID=3415750 RepID=UPI003CC6CD48
MTPQRLYIDGVALWTPALPGWAQARAALRGDPAPAQAAAHAPARPSPPLLAANERRRAPDSVLVALEVASAAVAMAGQDPATLASVFTSAHGDLAIVDALCSTLAANPLLLSPTRFHHSVHNAASGYWAIATGCRAPSSAVSGFEASFAIGFVEAASQLAADGVPVLLAGFDTDARGPLASVNRSRGLLGVALVLAPAVSAHSLCAVDWCVHGGSAALPPLQSGAAQALEANAMADALPLFELLARAAPATAATPAALALPLGPAGVLQLSMTMRAPASDNAGAA